MLETPTIQDVKAKHEELYDLALRQAPKLRRALVTHTKAGAGAAEPTPSEREGGQKLLGAVNDLLANLTNLSSRVSSFEDYRWLSHTAVKWQNVFAFLDLPTFVKLDPPSERLLPPVEAAPAITPESALTEHELDYWIKTHAELFAYTRIAKFKRFSTQEEIENDRHLAFVYLASDILDGKINFVKRIAPKSYWHLERVWMEDLKLLRAYILWVERGGGFGLSQREKDYFDVCEHLRHMLVDTGIKAPPASFEPVRRHLTEEFLTRGKIDPERNDLAKWLIGDKAYRLFSKTGNSDSEQNWFDAETYVKTFYESIIPAVLDGDDECTLAVLKAFQCDRSNPRSHYLIINAFEATLATYFMCPDRIQRVWDRCRGRATSESSSIISVVQVPNWPSRYEVPTICQGLFEVGDGAIRFRGVMSPDQKQAILGPLSGAHRKAVESLYDLSRSACRPSTL